MCLRPKPPVIKRAMASADGGQQEPGEVPGGGQPAVPDGSPVMPENIIIGTANAFRGDKAYSYQKKHIGPETIYVCEKGSKWARKGEVLVLRCYRGNLDCRR